MSRVSQGIEAAESKVQSISSTMAFSDRRKAAQVVLEMGARSDDDCKVVETLTTSSGRQEGRRLRQSSIPVQIRPAAKPANKEYKT